MYLYILFTQTVRKTSRENIFVFVDLSNGVCVCVWLNLCAILGCAKKNNQKGLHNLVLKGMGDVILNTYKTRYLLVYFFLRS